MEFKQLEVFINVVKYKSFSKAAEATFLTQPTISTHISALEKELGVKLVDRKGKESRPTKQGRALYNYAINIINTRERALNAMSEFNTEMSGTLEIKASSVPGMYIVPKMISEFSKLYPSVKFDVEVSDSEKVWGDILDNMGEIGFTGFFQNEGLKGETVVKDRLVAITPDTDEFRKLRKKGTSITLSELAKHPFIWREAGSGTRKVFEEKLSSYESCPEIRRTVTVNNMEGVIACVTQGMGVSVVSSLSVSEKNDRGYLVFEIEDMKAERDFYMVYNKRTTLSPEAQKFKEFVEKRYIDKETVNA